MNMNILCKIQDDNIFSLYCIILYLDGLFFFKEKLTLTHSVISNNLWK